MMQAKQQLAENEDENIAKRFTKHSSTDEVEAYWAKRKKYVNQYMSVIRQPFCNFAD